MNDFAFNGSALNGVATQLIQAAADVVCSAGIVASATRNVLPFAEVVAAAEIVASSTHIQAAGADVLGTVGISATAKHTQAGTAKFDGSAEILATVLRVVQAEAVFQCSAQMIVIPASTLGAVNVLGTASVVATGTKIQTAKADAVATANVVAGPRVIRYVSAQVAGSAAFRVEAKVNNQLDAFADITGTAEFTSPNVGIVIRLAEANVDCRAEVVPAVAYLHASTQATIGASASVEAVATIQAITGAFIRTCEAEVVAAPTRVVMPRAAAAGSAEATGRASLNHAGSVQAINGGAEILAFAHREVSSVIDFSGTAEIIPIGTAIRGARVDASVAVNTASVDADATVTRAASTVVQKASAEIIAIATAYQGTNAYPSCTANVIAAPTVRQAARVVVDGGEATVTAIATRIAGARAAVVAGAQLSASAWQRQMARAAVTGTANITASMRSNTDALDPPERTLRRPYEDTLMRRPYEYREMRRAA